MRAVASKNGISRLYVYVSIRNIFTSNGCFKCLKVIEEDTSLYPYILYVRILNYI